MYQGKGCFFETRIHLESFECRVLTALDGVASSRYLITGHEHNHLRTSCFQRITRFKERLEVAKCV